MHVTLTTSAFLIGDDVAASAEATTANAKTPVSQEKAKEDGQVAMKHLRTLITLLITNSEARKLVSDFGLIGRDLVSKTLVKVRCYFFHFHPFVDFDPGHRLRKALHRPKRSSRLLTSLIVEVKNSWTRKS